MTGPEPPLPQAGFRWDAAPWGVVLVAESLARFRHGWSTRQLALRGTPETEANGWSQLAAMAGVDPAGLVRLRQVHGSHVYEAASGATGPAPEADAAVCRDAGLALTVQTADCVPLLFGDILSGAVAVAHAGWRGTAAGVSREAVLRLQAGPADHRQRPTVVAALGPSIGPCCYEVGPELRERFAAAGWSHLLDAWFQVRGGRWYLDLWKANRDQLLLLGLLPGDVHVSGLCTACHRDWFPSYRRDGVGAGRMAGVIASPGSR